MARELAISSYLLIFKIIFNLFKLIPLRNKVTFVVSFGDNSAYVYKEIKKAGLPVEVVFLQKKSCKYDFRSYAEAEVLPFETLDLMAMVRSIYHLATSKYVLIDNYFGFLASIRFKKGAECVQLWHAAGAIKKFGLHDPSNENRSSRAMERFKKVYHNFHKLVVGSEDLAEIYFEAFGVKDENILRTGIPRTDLFYEHEKHEQVKNKLMPLLPELNGRKIILYAPTYREADLEEFKLYLHLDDMYKELKESHIVILRLHPAVNRTGFGLDRFENFVYDFTDYPEMNELLFICDYLITDYSSIPFEFSLLQKPMIFYPYDLAGYGMERGFWKEYETLVPGPITFDTQGIVDIIQNDNFDFEKIQRFSEDWNQYSKGNSSANLVHYMMRNMNISLQVGESTNE